MKLDQAPKRGSMGIPPEMTEAFDRQRAAAAAKRKAEDSTEAGPTPVADPGFETDEPQRVDDPDAPVAEEKAGLNPETLLKEIGVEITDDDLHRFVFKGFIEKDIKLSLFGGRKTVLTTLKTLTANEYDAVGELLGAELNDNTIMRDEIQVRRNMWTLSLGVTKIEGRQLAKPVMMDIVKDGKPAQKVDMRASARLYREVLGSLAAPVVSEMITAHGKLSLALDLMTKSQGAEVLKK